ncbi:MAG: hypothetical protein CVU38_19705 [Chloroflexi bacterium HGW-Chloroflexi-1]|nr:MAG: hypothetical protein CVU38_19705 [Chloroflexi bacterium HGW-Chloroflexi-1]
MLAEVVPGVVQAIRDAGGRFHVNVAHADGLERCEIGPIEMAVPAVDADRSRLVEAVAQAEELSTAVPGVASYRSPGPGSIHRILAEGLRRKAATGGPRAVIYAAENHNHAAEILAAAVLEEVPAAERTAVRARVRFLNTVIGKMSGVVTDADAIRDRNMATMAPGYPRAFLVEAFNRILISQIRFDEMPGEPAFQRGIRVFEEKPDLLPFEEAKLYGHNATHALAAYLGFLLGVPTIAELPQVPGVLPFLRAAFIEESGAALVKKHAGLDPLFTPAGYAAYADDLLARMVNPNLLDTVARVGRDPARKLAWDDRLVGTMRVALAAGVSPERYAMGAAAALAFMAESRTPPAANALPALLDRLWADAEVAPDEREAVGALIVTAVHRLARWAKAGYPPLERFWTTV